MLRKGLKHKIIAKLAFRPPLPRIYLIPYECPLVQRFEVMEFHEMKDENDGQAAGEVFDVF